MNLIENEQILINAINSVKKLHINKQKKSQFKQLFEDEVDGSRSKINLVVSLCKIPKIPQNGKVQPVTIRSSLPHSIVDDLTDILLITKNLKGFKREFEHAVQSYEDLLREHGASKLITQVMPIGQLKYEHVEYESKRALASRFDIVLCDSAIIRLLPRLLGKPFYSKKKRPIGVNLKANDVKSEISKVLSKAYLHLNLEGNSAMMQVARFNQNDKDIAENIVAVTKALKLNLPGGWKNVRSLHLKTEISKAIPLYINSDSASEIPDVPHPQDKVYKNVEDELSTIGDHIVCVNPSGDLKVIPKTVESNKRKEFLDQVNEAEATKYNRYDPASNSIVKGKAAKNKRTWSSIKLKEVVQ